MTDTPTGSKSREYWEKQRKMYLSRPALFGKDANQKNYNECLANRRGLLGGSKSLINDSIGMIASGLTELGLETAGMAKRFAEAALDIGDLVYPNEPVEQGKHVAYRSIAIAKWILGEAGWEPLYRESAQYWCEYLSGPPSAKFDPFLRKMHVWEAVIPFLLIGDIKRAADEFEKAYRPVKHDPNKVKHNARDEGRTIGTLVAYLSGRSELKDLAEKTLAGFRTNIANWGNDEGSQLWREIFKPEHVSIARVWAHFFSGNQDPITIILSIRGNTNL